MSALNEAEERCAKAAETLEEILSAPDKGVPQDLFSKAHCVVIVPGMIKGGFIVGGKYGRGVISCRGPQGKGWTGPTSVRMEGGSVGFQIGGSKTDLLLLVMNQHGKSNLLESKFTLGGDASVAAGPVGRTANAQTDAQMQAEILAYSRSQGVFAGISLEGATLRPDPKQDEELYGKRVDRFAVLDGKVPVPQGAQVLVDTLTKYSTQEHR
ncbi:MAG: lipid-binding SYLF domain-containing protein [Bryobacterales bacterium]